MDRSGSAVDPDLAEVIDQELSRLPAKYRSPLILCYIEGRTHEEAARDLHWPLGTVKGRLARARDLLRSRLARRGFAPTAGVLGVLSSPDLRAVLDRSLIERTVGAAVKLAAGHSVAQVVSQSITSLVEGVMGPMFLIKMKWAVPVLVATGFAFTTAAVLGRQEARRNTESQKIYEKRTVSSPPGTSGEQKDDKDFMKTKNREPEPAKGDVTTGEGLGRFGGGLPPTRDDGRANDPRSRQILEKLEEPLSMSFANETPLDDVLKYIKQATTSPKFAGIPIYVDPKGLQEAERSLNSTIQIDVDGAPLRRTLQLMLAQLDLAYFVEDGILVITSHDSAYQNHLPPSMTRPMPIFEMQVKANRGELTLDELKELVEVLKLRNEVSRLASGEGAKERRPAGEAAKKNDNQSVELIKELRELIQILKAERQAKQSEVPAKK
jgi:hypothetical protein